MCRLEKKVIVTRIQITSHVTNTHATIGVVAQLGAEAQRQMTDEVAV